MKGKIFINYRKEDSNWASLALYNELRETYDKDNIFKDFNTIEPGEDFVESIQNALLTCDVLLVIIGSQWLTMKEKDGTRRLDNPNDFVRIEIKTALERDIRVIPALFDDTKMPSTEQLPDGLKALSRRQAIEISKTRFEEDVAKLVQVINKVLASETINEIIPREKKNIVVQEEIPQKINPPIEKKTNVQIVTASAIKRFLNCLIDASIVGLVNYFLIYKSLEPYYYTGYYNYYFYAAQLENARYTSTFVFYVFYFFYYVLLEIKLGRTIGKMITKTKVSTISGERPNWVFILLRTLCRFIPLEQFSFLFNKDAIGWHDKFSKTRVINV